MTATMALKLDMMNVEISCRTAAWHRATMVIAREHLLAYTRRHGRGRALRSSRIERAKLSCVARRALEHLGRDIDLTPGAVLSHPTAVRALLICDLVRGRACAAPR